MLPQPGIQVYASRIERGSGGRLLATHLVRPGDVERTRLERMFVGEVGARHLGHLKQAVGGSLVEQEVGTTGGDTPLSSSEVPREAAQYRAQRVELSLPFDVDQSDVERPFRQ